MTIGKGISELAGEANASPAGSAGSTATSAATAGSTATSAASTATTAVGPSSVPASPIEFRLDPASGVPTYLQLVQQVEHALRLGYLKPGDQLPKVRDVVASLAINPNTVLKAYRELETKGLTSGRPGQGTFIEATLTQVALPELTGLRRTLLGWLATADTAGLDEDGIVALFTSVLRDFHERRGGSGHRHGPASGKTAGSEQEGVA
jgi:GntR family transcriptional regulator